MKHKYAETVFGKVRMETNSISNNKQMFCGMLLNCSAPPVPLSCSFATTAC